MRLVPFRSVIASAVRSFRHWSFATLALAGLSAPSIALAGGPTVPTPNTRVLIDEETVDRYIVKLKDPTADVTAALPGIAARLGSGVSYVRPMGGGAHVIRATTARGLSSARIVSQQAMADPNVAYIEPDRRMYAKLVPNDPQYGGAQWDLFEAAGGINAPAAWDITTGAPSVVAAVIDTGYRPHVDLANRFVGGYDFVSSTNISNDGDGRDPDAQDPGDWCPNPNLRSSWHGTHVSGTIGAASNNGIGITGINWVSKLLPVRVLGQCYGYTSDIMDGVRWAAGLPVSGVPNNPNPARVVNLSLGGEGACDNTSQSAINAAVAAGTTVVVAAGNSGADVSTSSPANCQNVIAVAATTRTGGRASFSNYGAGVSIAAPGVGIVSTLNDGMSSPGNDTYASYSGTSMATPHVSGVVSLMLSVNPSLTPAQVKSLLQQTARAFPTGNPIDCTTSTCGPGIVDAAAAVRAAGGTPPSTTRMNLASQANGGVASASSTVDSRFPASGVNNGDRKGANWEAGGGWNDGSINGYPDWIRVDFPSAKSVSEIDVFTLQDNYRSPVEPTESMTFSQYGITAFDVQYWNGSAWVTVPGGSVTGNNKVWSKFTFTPVTTSAIRVQVNAALAGYSRVVEIEAYDDAPLVNAARPANGGSAVASSEYNAGFGAAGAVDGDRRGTNWASGGGWNDATINSFPDALQVNFNGTRSINEIDVFTVQDNFQSPSEPTSTMTFTQYGIVDFDVQTWNGSSWVTVPNGSVTGNNLVWRKFSFSAVSTNAIRVVVKNALGGYARITELEAYVAQ